MSDLNPSPAVTVAKNHKDPKGDPIIELPYGVKARLVSVATPLLDEVTRRIVDPEVPTWRDPDKGREEPNPNDPAYLKAMAEAQRQRGVAVMDALIMFGVELIDGLPSDDGWLKKLKLFERRGLADLSGYDLDDPLDREFLFKRLVGVDNTILQRISELSSITPAEVEAAEKSFPGGAAR